MAVGVRGTFVNKPSREHSEALSTVPEYHLPGRQWGRVHESRGFLFARQPRQQSGGADFTAVPGSAGSAGESQSTLVDAAGAKRSQRGAADAVERTGSGEGD